MPGTTWVHLEISDTDLGCGYLPALPASRVDTHWTTRECSEMGMSGPAKTERRGYANGQHWHEYVLDEWYKLHTRMPRVIAHMPPAVYAVCPNMPSARIVSMICESSCFLLQSRSERSAATLRRALRLHSFSCCHRSAESPVPVSVRHQSSSITVQSRCPPALSMTVRGRPSHASRTRDCEIHTESRPRS